MAKKLLLVFMLSAFNSFVKAQTWVTLSSPTTQNLNTVYFLNKDTGFVAGASGTILKTTNGGTTWTALTAPTTNNISKIFFVNNDSGYVLAGSLIYKTVNGGSSWTYIGSFTNAGTIYFLNSSFGFVRGQSYIWRTLNGGASWDSTLLAFTGWNPWYEINFVSSSIGYVSFNGAILKSTNLGTSWSSVGTLSYPSPNQPIDFKFYNSNYGFILSGYVFNYVSKTSNGGTSWSSWTMLSGLSGASKILATSINKVFVMGTNQIYTSSDTGSTWSPMTISASSGLTDFFMVNDSIGYAVGNGGAIFKTLPGAVAGPSVAPSTFFIGGITTNSMILNWTSGNGTGRIVVACAGSNTLIAPSYGVSYSASSTFGSGNQIGTGNYVVYNGTGSSVTVTGLNYLTAYFFRVYEYSGTGTNTNYLTSAYATNGAMTLLPVKLISFTAEEKNKMVNLNWQTASELNNDYFEIEMAVHCAPCTEHDWQVIGKVKGKGTSNVVNSYQFTDVSAPLDMTGAFYYRLKQVDFDGKSTLSDVRVINFNQTNTDWNIYPNPATNELHIETTGSEKLTAQLFDVTGKQVILTILFTNTTNINTSSINEGLYFIRITNAEGGVVKTQKVAVAR